MSDNCFSTEHALVDDHPADDHPVVDVDIRPVVDDHNDHPVDDHPVKTFNLFIQPERRVKKSVLRFCKPNLRYLVVPKTFSHRMYKICNKSHLNLNS